MGPRPRTRMLARPAAAPLTAGLAVHSNCTPHPPHGSARAMAPSRQGTMRAGRADPGLPLRPILERTAGWGMPSSQVPRASSRGQWVGRGGDHLALSLVRWGLSSGLHVCWNLRKTTKTKGRRINGASGLAVSSHLGETAPRPRATLVAKQRIEPMECTTSRRL